MTVISDELERSIAIIRANQTASGAYLASPTFLPTITAGFATGRSSLMRWT